jgi:uncharacterized protein involved in tolerance to divalent cations
VNIVKEETEYISPKKSMLIIVIASFVGCLILFGTCAGLYYWRHKFLPQKETRYLQKDDEKYATSR